MVAESTWARPCWWVICLALLSSHCSLALKWDADGLPCDSNVRDGATYFCDAGYSCQTDALKCLRDQSVGQGQVCTQARQCKGQSICPIDLLGGGGVKGQDGILSCLPACNANSMLGMYLAADGCVDPTQACLPYLDRLAQNSNKALVGGCDAGARCTDGQSCTTDGNATGSCIQVAPKANACLVGCEVTWTGQAYSDNCDSLHSCQPVGMAGHQNFICTYNAQTTPKTPLADVEGIRVQDLGAACSPVAAPCARGNVCAPATNTCAMYCQITTNQTFPCPTGQKCCPFSTFSTPPETGYCSSSCSP